jgi:lysine-N-methylase
VPVTEEERKRIESQGWENDAQLARMRLFVRRGRWWSRKWRLNHRPEGGCVFLSEDNRCRIHERFGAEAKPLACRLFPFVLVPAGSHWRVGLRFACPSAADSKGRPLSVHENELVQLARAVERVEGVEAQTVPPPPLQHGQQVSWPDVLRFVQALLTLLEDRQDRLERRLRKCLALANLCRQARFDNISGGRLVEFLNLVTQGLDAEVPADPAQLPRPGWVGRVLFRQVLAIYLRKDRGEKRGPATRSRLALLRAGWRFARGRGAVPRVNGLLGETRFERAEAAAGPLPLAAEDALARYYQVKVNSLQFCGPANFRMTLWDGLESLVLTLPCILWLTRAMADGPRDEAVRKATGIVDDHFGFNPVLGSGRVRFAQRTLGRRGELEKLIAWYSR